MRMNAEHKSMIKGMIILWYGAYPDIPEGWIFCNGDFGTPDLRNKFIVGTGPSYPQGTTGGGSTHFHALGINSHNHTIPVGTAIAAGSDFGSTCDLSSVVASTDAGSNIPPYHSLLYIMKS